MSTYITDRSYIYNQFGPNDISGAVLHGGRTPANTGSYIDTLIAEQSSIFDSYASVNYPIPVSPVDDVVKSTIGIMVYAEIMNRANKPLSNFYIDKLNHAQGFLNGIKNGSIKLPGVVQDLEKGKGGTYIGPSGSNAPLLSIDRLKGTFF